MSTCVGGLPIATLEGGQKVPAADARLNELMSRPSTAELADVNRQQPSKYQCDGNDEHDAGDNHQNLEGVVARSVLVRTLYALHGHGRTPCQQTPVYSLALLFTRECAPSHSA
jgi:hypothetical protein